VTEEENKINVYLTTADFTVQNVALKIGIPVQSIDGMRIRKIKNYLLKCYACETFNWDTTKLFCEHCGYSTLMKIGYSVNSEGKVTVNDKKADARLRGTQVNLLLI
jgi:RNA-binding protein NOB1